MAWAIINMIIVVFVLHFFQVHAAFRDIQYAPTLPMLIDIVSLRLYVFGGKIRCLCECICICASALLAKLCLDFILTKWYFPIANRQKENITANRPISW